MTRITFIPIYDPLLILLSVGVAFIGSYITICFCEQFRQLKLPDPLPSAILGEKGMILAMAVSLGGIAVWAMHFCGMQSMHLADPEHVKIEIRYSIWRTVVSLVVSVTTSAIGLYIGSLDKMFGKTKQEIVEMYVDHASKMSLKEVRKISTARMIWIISTQSLGHMLLGGFLTGSGVSVMHFLGMWGLEFDRGQILWDKGIMAASVLIALIASTVAFWILFRLLSLYSRSESLRLLSAAFLTIAVCGSHYTCMASAIFRFDPSIHFDGDPTDSSYTAFEGAENTALILSVVLLVVMIIEVRSTYLKLLIEYRRVTNTNSSREGSSGSRLSRGVSRVSNAASRVASHIASRNSRINSKVSSRIASRISSHAGSEAADVVYDSIRGPTKTSGGLPSLRMAFNRVLPEVSARGDGDYDGENVATDGHNDIESNRQERSTDISSNTVGQSFSETFPGVQATALPAATINQALGEVTV